MQIYSSLVYFLFLLVLFILSASFVKGKKERLVYVSVPVAFFLLKIFLIFFNEKFGIFGAKIAGNFTLDLYELYRQEGFDVFLTSRGMKTFRPQLAFNLVAFELLGGYRGIMLVTNSALTTLAGVVGFFGLKKMYGTTVGLIAMILINVYPAAINFSFFGLRDPVIYFAVVWNVVAFLQLYKQKSFLAFIGFIVSVFIIILSRPELVAIIFFPVIFTVLFLIKESFQKIKILSNKIFMTCVLLVFFVIPSLVAVVGAYTFVVGKLGRVVSPIELMEVNAELRYARAEKGSGGMSGSHILPPNIYKALPWYARWPIQTLGIIILPFPWMVTSVSKALAFTDSLFLIFLIFLFLKYKRYLPKEEIRLHTATYLSFIMGLLVMGMIISNAGNAFRMRLTIAPYVLIPAAVYLGVLFKQTGFYRILAELLRPTSSTQLTTQT